MFKKKKKVIPITIEKQFYSEIDSREIKGYLNEQTMLFGDLKSTFTYTQLYNILLDRMKNRLFTFFEYEGLSDEIPTHFIEKQLFTLGRVLLFDVGGVDMVSNISEKGDYNIYKEPIHIIPMYLDGTQGSVKKNNVNCVIIKNNFTAMSTLRIVEPFLNRKAKNFTALEENIDTSINKWLITSSSVSNKNDMQKAVDKLKKPNSKYVFVPSDTNMKVEQNPFYEPFSSKEWWEDINNTNAFMLTELGIPANTNEDKKERLVVDEVNIKRLESLPVYYSMVRSRYEAIQRYNEITGKNIKFKAIFDFSQGGDNIENQEGGNEND